jgi:hypothetical protein
METAHHNIVIQTECAVEYEEIALKAFLDMELSGVD